MAKAKQFEGYSNYYDLLYKDKDYRKESDFILKVLARFSKFWARDLLSLGSGTGTYELMLRNDFRKIIGVDMSSEMVKIANDKSAKTGAINVEFKLGDVRTFRTDPRFDTVMAMFNIAGYQTTNADFEKFIKTASVHLKKGGLFLFDAWYQPAVLKDRPTDRVKEIRIDKHRSIIRKTRQKLDVERGLLNINFKVTELLDGKAVRTTKELNEIGFLRLM